MTPMASASVLVLLGLGIFAVVLAYRMGVQRGWRDVGAMLLQTLHEERERALRRDAHVALWTLAAVAKSMEKRIRGHRERSNGKDLES